MSCTNCGGACKDNDCSDKQLKDQIAAAIFIALIAKGRGPETAAEVALNHASVFLSKR